MNKLVDNSKRVIRMLLPALIIVICYVVSIKFGNMVYYTNDDTSIQDALSGNTTGQPYPLHQFIGVLLGFPIAFLYKIFPTIQWWFVWSHFLVILGLLFINYSIVIISKKNNYPYFIGLCFAILIDLSFAFFPISNISYTIVPAILGAGVVALCFLIDDNNKKSLSIIMLICFIALLSHRQRVGQVVLCFILLSILHISICKKTLKKDFLKLGVIFVALFCLTMGIGKVSSMYQSYINGPEFKEFNSARVKYMDYPHDTFENNPEIFESIGWNYEKYRLAQAWCYLDEDVNAENFRFISEHSSVQDTIPIKKLLTEQIKNCLDDILVKVILLVWSVSILSSLGILISGDEKRKLITWGLNLVGSLFLIALQIFMGRILYRSLIGVLFPSLIINIMLMLSGSSHTKRRKIVYFLIIVFAGSAVFGSAKNLEYTFNKERLRIIEDSIEKDSALREYGIANKDNIYIQQIGITSNVSPYLSDVENKNTNIIPWGGSTHYSDAFYKRLACNNLDSLNGTVFMRDNVYLISGYDAMKTMKYEEHNLFCIFYNWLKKDYHAIGFIQEESISEGLYVYKFVFKNNAEQLEFYYDYEGDELLQYKFTES